MGVIAYSFCFVETLLHKSRDQAATVFGHETAHWRESPYILCATNARQDFAFRLNGRGRNTYAYNIRCRLYKHSTV